MLLSSSELTNKFTFKQHPLWEHENLCGWMHACQELGWAGPPLENLACQQTEEKWWAVSLNPWATLLLADKTLFQYVMWKIDIHNIRLKKNILKCLFKMDTILHWNMYYYSIWKTFFKLMPINKFHLQ